MVEEFLKSVEDFTKEIDKKKKYNKIEEGIVVNFNRYVTFNKNKIPLGKFVIDYINKKIFIYETFCDYTTVLSKPDIYIINFKDLKSCESKNENENLIISISTKKYGIIELDFKSILNRKAMEFIFVSLHLIIMENNNYL